MLQLELDLVAILSKYKNVYSQYADRINVDLVTDLKLKEILFDLIVNARDKSFDYYALLAKYGELLPETDVKADNALEESNRLINRLMLSACQNRLNSYCTNYTKEHISGNNPSVDSFLEKIKNLNVNTDDIAIFDSTDLVNSIQNNMDIEVPHITTKFGSFRKGSVVILAGRPGMGKTTAAGNLFVDAINQQQRSVFFSLEMPDVQIYEIVKCVVMDKPSHDKTINQGQYSKLEDFIVNSKNNLYVVDKERLNLKSIERVVNRITVKTGKPELVIIDNLNLIGKLKDKEYDALSEITAELKILAKQLDIVLLVIAHLNRENSSRQNKKPILSDLRGSGTIEQDADYVVFVHREDYYHEEKGDVAPAGTKNILEWWHAKNRFDEKERGHYHINFSHKRINGSLTEFEQADYQRALNNKFINVKNGKGGF